MAKHKIPKDLIKTASDKRAVAEGCWFDESRANRVTRFFETCLVFPHGPTELVGKPYQLIPWQAQDILRPLFGWVRPDGRRRFTHASIWVPKKNSKTVCAAGIVDYLMLGDGKKGKHIYSAAREREQAAYIFEDARDMITPALRERVSVLGSHKTLTFHENNNVFKSLASEAGNVEGLRVFGMVFDEIHVQRDRRLYATLRFGMSSEMKADEPMWVEISTAGLYDPSTIGFERYRYAKGILSGDIIDTETLAVVYEAPEDADLDDPLVLKACNPSVGYSLSLDELVRTREESKISPPADSDFRRYRCNQWVNAINRALPAGAWMECQGLELDSLKDRECYGGLDVGMRRDLSAFVLFFPPAEDAKAACLSWFWTPSESLKKSEIVDVGLFAGWVNSGLVRSMEGDASDYDIIESDVLAACEEYGCHAVAYDKWNADNIAVRLESNGVEMLDTPQRCTVLNQPFEAMLDMVCKRQLSHDGNEVMTWMSSNLESYQDRNGYKRPMKNKATPQARIDGMSALVFAIAAWQDKTKTATNFQYTGMGG